MSVCAVLHVVVHAVSKHVAQPAVRALDKMEKTMEKAATEKTASEPSTRFSPCCCSGRWASVRPSGDEFRRHRGRNVDRPQR